MAKINYIKFAQSVRVGNGEVNHVAQEMLERRGAKLDAHPNWEDPRSITVTELNGEMVRIFVTNIACIRFLAPEVTPVEDKSLKAALAKESKVEAKVETKAETKKA